MRLGSIVAGFASMILSTLTCARAQPISHLITYGEFLGTCLTGVSCAKAEISEDKFGSASIGLLGNDLQLEQAGMLMPSVPLLTVQGTLDHGNPAVFTPTIARLGGIEGIALAVHGSCVVLWSYSGSAVKALACNMEATHNGQPLALSFDFDVERTIVLKK